MKKPVLFIIVVFMSIALFSKPPVKGVHSIADFEKLYTDKVFPFNKISDTTFQRLKSGIAFDDKKNLRGFLFVGGLRKELSYEEYQKFNELITGEKVIFTDEDKAEYERRRNRK